MRCRKRLERAVTVAHGSKCDSDASATVESGPWRCEFGSAPSTLEPFDAARGPVPWLSRRLLVRAVGSTFIGLLACGGVAGCFQNHELFVELADAGPSDPPDVPKKALGEPCDVDTECITSGWCTEHLCTACPSISGCRPGFNVIRRNGCDWCAPPNECITDSACGGQQKCYAGLQCEPGCNGALTCCHGNLCGDRGCGTPIAADCSKVGCADGGRCVGTATVSECECEESAGWSCSTTGGSNQCELEQ